MFDNSKKVTLSCLIFIACSVLLLVVSCGKKKAVPQGEEQSVIEEEKPAAPTTAETAVDTSKLKFYEEFLQFKYKSVKIKDIIKDIEKVEKELSQKIKKVPKDYKIIVIGHADKRGPEEPIGKKPGNITLSKMRAEAVISYFSKKYKIPRDKFEIVAKGSSELKSKKKPYSGVNRRVEIKFE